MVRDTLVLSGSGVALVVLIGCSGDELCPTDSYPSAPEGAASVLHVSSECSSDDADGSAERPFSSIRAAVDRASPGAAVLIAKGTYREDLTLSKDISLIGSSSATDAQTAAAIIEGSSTLSITGGTALLRGLQIAGAKQIGIRARGANVTVEACQVRGTQHGEDGNYGYGVVASEQGGIILQHSVITGSAGVGVLVSSARGIILQNTIEKNEGGGVRIENAMDEVEIDGNTLVENVQLGVGIFNSRAIILQNEVRGTLLDDIDIGDGILVAGFPGGAASSVTVGGNVLEGNGRVGILCSGELSRGIILQRNRVVGSGSDKVGAAAGIWLQLNAGGEPGNVIEENEVTGSRFVGVGLSGDTHAIILQNNLIQGTQAGQKFDGATEIVIGDGINLFNGASANMRRNTVNGNARFGLIADDLDVSRTTISENVFNDNEQYGIILQNQSGGVSLTDNTVSGNGAGDVLTPAGSLFPTQSVNFSMRSP